MIQIFLQSLFKYKNTDLHHYELKGDSFYFIDANGKICWGSILLNIFCNFLLFLHSIETPIQLFQLAMMIMMIIK